MNLKTGGTKQGDLGNQNLASNTGPMNNIGSKGSVKTPDIQAYPSNTGPSLDRKVLGDHGNDVYGNYAK